MLKRNVLLFFRKIKKDKTSFLINLIGLSTGLACVILIYLWINDEFNIDKFHENDSQLYQVMTNYNGVEKIDTWESSPSLLAEVLIEEMPEVECATVLIPPSNTFGEGILTVGNKHIKANAQFTNKDFFSVFSYPLIQGDKNQVLKDKNGVVISEGLAKKIFNTTKNVVGKTVVWENRKFKSAFLVTGILKDIPANSTSQFDLIFNYEVFLENNPWAKLWTNYSANTYLILKKNTNINNFNEKIEGILESKATGSAKMFTLFVQQYSKKYLHGQYENGVQTGGRMTYVRLFSIIAIFLLLIACINFMNLSTARASKRTKEVGIKKATGVNIKTLVVQFLGESILMAFLSLIVAILLVVFLLPQFNELTGKQLHLNFELNIILSIVGIVVLTGLVSGSYPAFYLSRFNPATALKGKVNTSLGELWIRKGLVIFQFALSVIFIVGFLIINKQIEFTQTKNLGYSRDNIISFERKGKFTKNYETFVSEMKNIPGVVNASGGDNFLKELGYTSGFSWEGQDRNIKVLNVQIGNDFIEMLGLELLEGRSFSKEFGNEKSKIILNEVAINRMGLSNPIGKTIKQSGIEFQIIGAVKNFHYGSLHKNVEPFVFKFHPSRKEILVKINTRMANATVESLKKLYEKSHPGYPFEFTFLDDDYQALYESENKVAVLSKYFSAIAIIISCLGLFGLAAFTVERRRKEIGIRKVHGSSGIGIMKLVTSDFSMIVVTSIAISLPISYLIMKNWLDGFAYRIALSWWFFAAAGFIALFVAWLTVGSQALKASNINPAVCLKDE